MEKKENKKERWSSVQRLEKKKGQEKPEKTLWETKLKKHRDMRDEHKKKRQERTTNRKVLEDKGVVKA